MFYTDVTNGFIDAIYKNGGSVLVTSSSAVYEGQPGVSLYSASKAAMLSAARCWASELAPRGIRVNTLVPGLLKQTLEPSFLLNFVNNLKKNWQNRSAQAYWAPG